MLDISFGELAIIFTLCLLVLGPEKLPKLASQLGRLAGQARAMARHFRSQLEQEVQHEEMMKELRASDAALSKVLNQANSNPIEAIAAVAEATGTSAQTSTQASTQTTATDTHVESPGVPHPLVAGADPAFNLNGNSGAANAAPIADETPAPSINKPAA